jgi:hypothetical protein
MPIAAVLFSALALLVFSGCAMPKAQQGGRVQTQLSASGVTTNQVLVQGENPQQATTQITEEEINREFLPEVGAELDSAHPVQMPLSGTRPVKESIKRKTQTSLGAAQKDTARELAAKFADMKPVQWVGLVCLLGAGALAYFGWWTPAMIAGGTGLGLILLAHAIVGNERLILILLGAAAAILMVFRSYEKGKLDHILPDSLDKNQKEAAK